MKIEEKDFVWIALAAVVLLLASMWFNVRYAFSESGDSVYQDTVRITVVDTVRVYKPVPKKEKPLGNITAKLPVSVPKLPETPPKTSDVVPNTQDSLGNLAAPNHLMLDQSSKLVGTRLTDDFGISVPDDHFEDMSEMATPDSVDVVVPITQKVYEDSTYTAYVSGYRAILDSLIFRMPQEVTTITNTHYQKQKQKRWSIGIGVGYGITPKGVQPYVGVNLQCNLFSF